MNKQERAVRQTQIRTELRTLNARRDELTAEMTQLSFEDEIEHYSCECVRENRDIGVFDMLQQQEANRRPLGLGLVADTLSADRDCPICKGEGAPIHNDLCSTCRGEDHDSCGNEASCSCCRDSMREVS